MTVPPEYAGALALASVEIVAAVHRGDNAQPFIDVALAMENPPNVDPVTALVTVLAAQIDPDTTLNERLLWTQAFDPDVIEACRTGEDPDVSQRLPG